MWESILSAIHLQDQLQSVRSSIQNTLDYLLFVSYSFTLSCDSKSSINHPSVSPRNTAHSFNVRPLTATSPSLYFIHIPHSLPPKRQIQFLVIQFILFKRMTTSRCGSGSLVSLTTAGLTPPLQRQYLRTALYSFLVDQSIQPCLGYLRSHLVIRVFGVTNILV